MVIGLSGVQFRVCNHTSDNKIERPCSGSPICLSRIWLQTELDNTKSYYQLIIKITILREKKNSGLTLGYVSNLPREGAIWYINTPPGHRFAVIELFAFEDPAKSSNFWSVVSFMSPWKRSSSSVSRFSAEISIVA